MFKLLTRVLAAFALGLVISVWILQNNTSVKKQVYIKIITTLQKEWDAHIDVESFKINFFTCSIFFKDGTVFPTNKKNYAWKFEQGLVHVSPIQLLFNKRIALDIAFNNVKAYTTLKDKQVDLLDHVYGMFKQTGAGMPVAAESIVINNIDLAVKLTSTTDKNSPASHMVVVHAPGTIAFNKLPKHVSAASPHSWQGDVKLSDASLLYDNKRILQHLSGTSSLHKHRETNEWFCKTQATLTSAVLDHKKTYTCNATWNPKQKALTLTDQTGDLSLNGSLNQRIHLVGKIPLAILSNGINFMKSNTANTPQISWAPQGLCHADVTFDQNDATLGLTGSIILSDLKIASIPIQQIALQLSSTQPHQTASNIAITQSTQAQLSGSLTWNWNAGGGSLTLTNTNPLNPPRKSTPSTDFLIQPHDLKLSASFGKTSNTQGTYQCILTNAKTEKSHTYKGAFLFKDNALGIRGKTSRGKYSMDATLTPQPCLKNIQYVVNNRALIDLHTTAPFTLSGTVRWAFLRSFLDQSLQHLVYNDNCVLTTSVHQQDLTRLSGTCKLAQGRFFIPDFHNLIQNISLEWQADTAEQKINIDNVTIGLSKGSIICPHATATWDDQYNLSMLHAPLTIQNTFVNWKRDFYGITYGNLLLNKLPDNPAKLSGILVLKKSLLKDTFFNQDDIQNVYGPLGGAATSSPLPIGISVRLITEKPVAAKTPALNAAATLDLTVNNIVGKDFYSAPYLTGSINLSNGYLKFFNNKLQIEHGKIQFVANHINDPLIDLIAKNRINKYLINLQVTGSLQKPTILLESTPELTEEQIVGLLLSGSESASLQADLPAMLLQNLDSFLFKSRKNSKHAGLFDKISKTFKYIQITPNLTDNADAGKLKGSISVNLNDQLRAQIQKNLDLQKDFSAHIEYMLSDEINLKVIKDQRGELGSEVEMRLKLG